MWLKSYGLLKLEHSITAEIKHYLFQMAVAYMTVDPLHDRMTTNMYEWLLFCSSEVLLVYLKVQSHVLYSVPRYCAMLSQKMSHKESLGMKWHISYQALVDAFHMGSTTLDWCEPRLFIAILVQPTSNQYP